MQGKINTNELREMMAAELASRQLSAGSGSYSDEKGGAESLYGVADAVTLSVELGKRLGTFKDRDVWAKRILSYQTALGTFDGGDRGGHALCSAIRALNLLGSVVPNNVAPLAPTNISKLSEWLESLDWRDTHKDLWGMATPLLASGLVSEEWTALFAEEVSRRISPQKPLAIWHDKDDPPWRVISCIYHVLSTFDAGCIPYPFPEIILKRLMELKWEDASDAEEWTQCTDGDWAWMLLRLCELCPQYYVQAMKAIGKVSKRRIIFWQENKERIVLCKTHLLHCFIWVTALFQHTVREDFVGPYLKDTLNDPVMFRLNYEI